MVVSDLRSELLITTPPCLRRIRDHVDDESGSKYAQDLFLEDDHLSVSKGNTQAGSGLLHSNHCGANCDMNYFGMAPCSDALFWPSAGCWQTSANPVTETSNFIKPEIKRENSVCDIVTMGGVSFERSDSGEVFLESVEISAPAGKTTLEKGKVSRSDHRVRFSDSVKYVPSDEPLTDEEKIRYFWREADMRRFKEERRSLVTSYRNLVTLNQTFFWDDDKQESIRGLEDHTAYMIGGTISKLTRQQHERRVLLEVYQQRSGGWIDSDRLREVSQLSSVKSTRQALERAHGDRAAVVAELANQYYSPFNHPSIWNAANISNLWDSDGESDNSSSSVC